MNRKNDWIEIGPLDSIPRQGTRTLVTENGTIALFRTATDEVFAVRDQCPHKGGPLSAGIVHGSKVTCPLHNWVIDLASGEAVRPDEGATACFPIRVKDGMIGLKRS